MFLLDWFYGVLALLGLWQKEAKILFLGDDNGRKTTLLHMLRDERLVQHQPIQDLTWEEFSIGKIKFKTFNCSNQNPPRVLRDYNVQFDAVVCLVDWPVFCREKGAVGSSVWEMHGFLVDEALWNVPVLILVDRTDDQSYGHQRIYMVHIMADLLKILRFTSFGCLLRSILVLELEVPNVEPPVVCVGSIERNMGYRDCFQRLSQKIQ